MADPTPKLDPIYTRLRRVYAAIDAVAESDLSKFPPIPLPHGVFQDFNGGLTQAELDNRAYSVIHNIADFPETMHRWAQENGHERETVEQGLNASMPLQVIRDLSNRDKHPHPPRDGGRSGLSPKLQSVHGVLRMTTLGEKGSSVAMILTSAGPKQVGGSGSSQIVITGDVIAENGEPIGDLYELETQAVETIEHELIRLNVIE